MTKNEKPVAKSLHTITVIQQVTQYIIEREMLDPAFALDKALEVLGLAGRDDPYGLAAKAFRLMGK